MDELNITSQERKQPEGDEEDFGAFRECVAGTEEAGVRCPRGFHEVGGGPRLEQAAATVKKDGKPLTTKRWEIGLNWRRASQLFDAIDGPICGITVDAYDRVGGKWVERALVVA